METDVRLAPDVTRAEVYKELMQELDWFMRTFRDELNREPRILNPVKEARDAAKTKYDDAKDLL